MKILFLLRKRQAYGDYANQESGLANSAKFVMEMLNKGGISAFIETIHDDNDIDRVVTKHRPTTVVIEALHVHPSKFEALQKLHPSVKFIIRLHSDSPFLAMEGIAIEWLKGYDKYENVQVAANSHYMVSALKVFLTKPVLYFPNYYPVKKETIEVGCFGAIRPLKNNLTQALAAIKYADEQGLKLRFHINNSRIEQKGDNPLKNLKALFEGTKHDLIEHSWLRHEDFVVLVKGMDLVMQISLSETYNIVIADAVANNIPVIASTEVPFLSKFSQVKNTKDLYEITDKIDFILRNKCWLNIWNKELLKMDSKFAKKEILKILF